MSRKSLTGLILLSSVLLIIGAFEVVRYRSATSKPLGDPPRIDSHPAGFSELEKQQFLDSSFKIVEDVKALPAPVLNTFTEQGGSQPLIANPGEKFEAGDVVTDPSVPRKRLILAGVTDGRCFVHYAQGGRALAYVVEFFRLSSTRKIERSWKGYCFAPAVGMDLLRRCINRVP